MPHARGRNEPCPCGSGVKYKRCCLDRDREEQRARAFVTPDVFDSGHQAGVLTLMVDTPSGVLVRRVPNASPLHPDTEQGTAAEEAVHDSAAIWGLPDFSYRGVVRNVGSGQRELGDNFLVVGRLGIVIQVKSREARTTDSGAERRWIEKKTEDGLRQARGTIRQLRLAPASLQNARGRTVEIDGNSLRWLSVVVIDHPSPPDDVATPTCDPDRPSVVMLRRDWEFLFDQLKSSHAVGQYLERVAGDPVGLGEEPMRYYRLAMADQQAEPDEADPALLGRTGRRVSAPLLPMQSAALDQAPALLIRSLFEDIALSKLSTVDEDHRLAVLAELDRVPLAHRTEIGQFLLDGLAAISDVEEGMTVWRIRRILGGQDGLNVAFGVCSAEHSEMQQDFFGWWVQLRHHDRQQITTSPVKDLMTVAVFLTPRSDGLRPFDTTVSTLSGDLELEEKDVEAFREIWPEAY